MAEAKAKEPSPVSTQESLPAQRSRMPAVFEEFERYMDRFFDDFMAPRGWLHPMRWQQPLWDRLTSHEPRMPKVDMIDRDKEVVIRAEIPGVERKDLDISVTDNTVTIKGSSRHEHKEEEGDYYRCEIAHGTFARTLALPGEVDADQAKASFENGVLELTLPKLKSAHRRKIEIR